MSQDVIGGIAVIQRSRFWAECRVYRVHLLLCHRDGHRTQSHLCMTEGQWGRGDQNRVGEPIWQFTKGKPRHGWIECQPSVRVFSAPDVESFHNEGVWHVQYVEMRHQEPEPNQQRAQRNADNGAGIHFELNFVGMTDDQRAALFADLRERQIIY